MSESLEDEGIYDLKEESSVPVRPLPVISLEPSTALEYRRPTSEAIKTSVDTDTLKNFHIPLWLLVGGSVIDVISAAFWSGNPLRSVVSILVDLVFGTAFMLVGILLAAKLRHIELGNIRSALLKLAAICVAPPAAAVFISPIARFVPPVIIVEWIVEFVMYFALLGALFDLDEADTTICIITILLVRLAVFAAMVGIAHVI
jgi:hypothetical protein